MRTAAALLALAVLFEVLALGAERVVSRALDDPIVRPSTLRRRWASGVGALAKADRDQLDSVLGWRYRAVFSSATDHINARGLRATREYDPVPPPGVRRVASFGDSFVYGTEVADREAWSALVERMDSTTEVWNYGVGGYGVDQAYLRFLREGDLGGARLVLIGFATVDLRRLVNVFRPFLASEEPPRTKPRFVLVGPDSLELVPNPLRSDADYAAFAAHPDARPLGAADAYYEPLVYANPLFEYSAAARLVCTVWIRARRRWFDANRVVSHGVFNPASEAFGLQLALFAAFASEAERRGIAPVILFLPDVTSVERVRDGGQAIYATLRRAVGERGLPALDLLPAFVAARDSLGAADLFFPSGHYTAVGNRVAARAVSDFLRTR